MELVVMKLLVVEKKDWNIVFLEAHLEKHRSLAAQEWILCEQKAEDGCLILESQYSRV